MRFSRQHPQSPSERPPKAETFLAPEQRLDEGIEFDPQRDLTEKDWEAMKEKLETSRGTFWPEFGFRAHELVLLFPDRRAELNLDSKAFSGMKGELAKSRGSDWGRFSQGALDLAILAAQDARITPDGRIEITPKKRKLATEPPPLPQRPR